MIRRRGNLPTNDVSDEEIPSGGEDKRSSISSGFCSIILAPVLPRIVAAAAAVVVVATLVLFVRASSSSSSVAASSQDEAREPLSPNDATSGGVDVDVEVADAKSERRPRPRIPLFDDLIRAYPRRYFGAPEYWLDLLREGEALRRERSASSSSSSSSVSDWENIVEVGANRAADALKAARSGFRVHSFEPSPRSFRKIRQQLLREDKATTDRVLVYNLAVGDVDGATVAFLDSDSSGAHVVAATSESAVTVRTVTMDVFLEGGVAAPDFSTNETVSALRRDDAVYAAKIDVQGYEPFVVRGARGALKQRRVPYVMTEWWPRGIDSGADPKNAERVPAVADRCAAATRVLYDLSDAGYALFAAPLEAHPGMVDPAGLQHTRTNKTDRRFDDLWEDCLALYALEERFPNTQVERDFFGYWTDVIAVAPDAPLPETTVTRFGKAIKEHFAAAANSEPTT